MIAQLQKEVEALNHEKQNLEKTFKASAKDAKGNKSHTSFINTILTVFVTHV